MPLTGNVTVANLVAALDDVDPDTPIVVQPAGTKELLWISEISLTAFEERYRVDEALIALPAEYVVVTLAEKPFHGHQRKDNQDG